MLLASGSPNGQRHNVVLTWVMTRFARAVKDGHLIGGPGLEQAFIANCCVLRGKMGSLPDERVDRMPLAYMHIVQAISLSSPRDLLIT